MKIFTNDCVYVQKNDIAYLNQTDMPIPASIFMKVFGRGIITVINDSNRFNFVKFNEKEEIEYFKKLDWIIDYADLKDLSEDEIIQIGESVSNKRNELVDSYNSMNSYECSNNSDIVLECELLNYKIYSLRDFIWFKRGELNYILPNGVEYPNCYSKLEEKGLSRILKKFKKNK